MTDITSTPLASFQEKVSLFLRLILVLTFEIFIQFWSVSLSLGCSVCLHELQKYCRFSFAVANFFLNFVLRCFAIHHVGLDRVDSRQFFFFVSLLLEAFSRIRHYSRQATAVHRLKALDDALQSHQLQKRQGIPRRHHPCSQLAPILDSTFPGFCIRGCIPELFHACLSPALYLTLSENSLCLVESWFFY